MRSRDPGAWMWAEACDMLARAERMRRQFFRPGAAGARLCWEPPVDLYETEDELWILVALPGVAPEQLEVGVDGATLVVAGQRPIPTRLRSAMIHRLEIPYGRFERRIGLPARRLELRTRELDNGCLVLVLAKMS